MLVNHHRAAAAAAVAAAKRAGRDVCAHGHLAKGHAAARRLQQQQQWVG